MNEFEALSIAAEHNGESMTAMLNAAKQAGFTDEMENKLRFHSLYEQDYITGAFVLDRPVTITLKGKDRLKQLQEEAADRAEKKRQARLQNQLSVASIFVNLVIFIGGLVVEHYTGLVAFLLQFFG